MEAGKHVLVDKPLCLHGDEGERMLAAARAHPNQVMLSTARLSGWCNGRGWYDVELGLRIGFRADGAFMRERQHVRCLQVQV